MNASRRGMQIPRPFINRRGIASVGRLTTQYLKTHLSMCTFIKAVSEERRRNDTTEFNKFVLATVLG